MAKSITHCSAYIRGFRILLVAILSLWAMIAASEVRAVVILDSADANGIGDNGGSPFEFSFSALGDGPIEGALLEFLDYDSLGISIIDSNGLVVLPLIEFSPAQSILFDFMNLGSGDYTALVSAIGNGAFGLEIQQALSVPEPPAIALFVVGLIGVGALVWRRRDRPVA